MFLGKQEVIKKKKQKIKDLQSEIKTLKENEQRHSDTSSIDSLGEANIMMDLHDEMSSLSSGSSVSSTSLDSDPSFTSEIDEAVASFTSDILEGLERRYRNSPEEYQVDDDSIEYPRLASPFSAEETPVAAAAAALDLSTETEDETPIRRPAKRRLPSALLDTSDEDQDGLEMPPVPSPKRVWRFNRLDGGDGATNPQASDESFGQEGAGPSSSSWYQPPTSEDLEALAGTNRFRLRPRLGRRGGRNADESTAALAAESGARYYNGGTFERTIAMLSQYNLESDPEWVPGNPEDERDSVSLGEQDSFEIGHQPIRDGYITSSDESSLGDSDSDSSLEPTTSKKGLVKKYVSYFFKFFNS